MRYELNYRCRLDFFPIPVNYFDSRFSTLNIWLNKSIRLPACPTLNHLYFDFQWYCVSPVLDRVNTVHPICDMITNGSSKAYNSRKYIGGKWHVVHVYVHCITVHVSHYELMLRVEVEGLKRRRMTSFCAIKYSKCIVICSLEQLFIIILLGLLKI